MYHSDFLDPAACFFYRVNYTARTGEVIPYLKQLANLENSYPLKAFFLFLSEFMMSLEGVSAVADTDFLTKRQT